MGKVHYSAGIDYVQGSLAKPKVKNGHSCGSYLIGTHRVAETTNPNCTNLYIREADTYKNRQTAPSADELAAREKFATVSAAVAARAKDLTKMAADKAAFIAQKDVTGGRKTMKSFLWKLELEAYDQSNG